MRTEEGKELMVFVEYQNSIGMPVVIKRIMDEKQLADWRNREDVRIIKVQKKPQIRIGIKRTKISFPYATPYAQSAFTA
ncbi:MAG: hypothetical protein PUD20_09945 [bacterium]|nr:hypothetical protein [bacterium]